MCEKGNCNFSHCATYNPLQNKYTLCEHVHTHTHTQHFWYLKSNAKLKVNAIQEAVTKAKPKKLLLLIQKQI